MHVMLRMDPLRRMQKLIRDLNYAESTHSMDPAMATVEGSLPGLGERIVYFLRIVSMAVLPSAPTLEPNLYRP